MGRRLAHRRDQGALGGQWRASSGGSASARRHSYDGGGQQMRVPTGRLWVIPEPGDWRAGARRWLRHSERQMAASGTSGPFVCLIPKVTLLFAVGDTSNRWLMAPPVWKIGDVPALCCVYLSALNATLARLAIPVNAGICAGLINGRARRPEDGESGSKSRTLCHLSAHFK